MSCLKFMICFRSQAVVQLPLMQISDTAFDFWMRKDWTNAEAVLTEEITQSSSPSYHVLANRAFIRAHLEQWPAAQCDAEESLVIRPSAIGHIAKAMALIGKGEGEAAIRLFDLVFGYCGSDDNKILLIVKSIFLFLCGRHDDASLRLQDIIAVHDISFYSTIQAQMHVLKGKIYMKEGDYEHAIKSFKDAMVFAPVHGSLELQTISIIFGWSLDALGSTTQIYLCEALYAARHLEEAATGFKLLNSLDSKILSKETKEWMGDFSQQGLTASELNGDSAMDAGNHEEACMHYETALVFSPDTTKPLLTKWAKAKLMDNSWAVILSAAIQFQVPRITIYQAMVEALEAVGHVTAGNAWFQKMIGKLGEIVVENDQAKWVLEVL
ncbi:hypothetical protein J3R83DRAFT_5127 [Lanmaoa asiatica]|nr:hypothetical protein J3R83DRAFT_5127 [Lanmaoa asiatica]